MDFNIHDTNGVLIGIIENPTSAIWTRGYYTPGDFEIYTPATSEMLELIAPDCFITRADNNEVMLIERLEITTDAENGDFVRIAGRAASCLLDRRIVWEQTTLSGRVDNALYKIMRDNAISPADPARALPLTMNATDVLADTISAQHTGTILLEVLQNTCKAYGMGFRVVRDSMAAITPRLELYTGKDRRAGQRVNSPVIFSPEYENLLSTNYAFDVANYKNVALVAGEGEGKARKRAVYGAASGMHRRELYVDARDMSTNEGEISDSEYTAQLEARGAEKLTETRTTEAFDGETSTDNTFVFGVDYDTGDIVTTVNEYGIRADTRILTTTECWDENGYSVSNTFEGTEG